MTGKALLFSKKYFVLAIFTVLGNLTDIIIMLIMILVLMLMMVLALSLMVMLMLLLMLVVISPLVL